MEEWQLEAIKAIFETRVSEVEPGQRVYLSSESYGSRRYHIINKRYDGIQIEQLEADEKWSKKVNLQSDEIPGFLKMVNDLKVRRELSVDRSSVELSGQKNLP